jgi:hypothetical protein
MSASRSNVSDEALPQVVSLVDKKENENLVTSSVMAYFSSTGQFRFECDFKTEMERAALILNLEIALENLRGQVSAKLTPSLNLAA